MGDQTLSVHTFGECFLKLESQQWAVTAELQKVRCDPPSLPRWIDVNAAKASGTLATLCTDGEMGHGLGPEGTP